LTELLKSLSQRTKYPISSTGIYLLFALPSLWVDLNNLISSVLSKEKVEDEED